MILSLEVCFIYKETKYHINASPETFLLALLLGRLTESDARGSAGGQLAEGVLVEQGKHYLLLDDSHIPHLFQLPLIS